MCIGFVWHQVITKLKNYSKSTAMEEVNVCIFWNLPMQMNSYTLFLKPWNIVRELLLNSGVKYFMFVHLIAIKKLV